MIYPQKCSTRAHKNHARSLRSDGKSDKTEVIVDTQLIQSTEIAKMDGTEETAVVNNHDVKTTRRYEVTFPFRVPLSTAVARRWREWGESAPGGRLDNFSSSGGKRVPSRSDRRASMSARTCGDGRTLWRDCADILG